MEHWGQSQQPSSEYYSNILFDDWNKLNFKKEIWVEDESKSIGSIFIPDQFYERMQKSPVIAIMMDIKTRMPRLIDEYSTYPKEELIASVKRISRRLGGDNTRDAIEAIQNDDFEKAIEITLTYYDKAYMYGIAKRPARLVYFIETDTNNVEDNSLKVLETAKKIVWD